MKTSKLLRNVISADCTVCTTEMLMSLNAYSNRWDQRCTYLYNGDIWFKNIHLSCSLFIFSNFFKILDAVKRQIQVQVQ